MAKIVTFYSILVHIVQVTVCLNIIFTLIVRLLYNDAAATTCNLDILPGDNSHTDELFIN